MYFPFNKSARSIYNGLPKILALSVISCPSHYWKYLTKLAAHNSINLQCNEAWLLEVAELNCTDSQVGFCSTKLYKKQDSP